MDLVSVWACDHIWADWDKGDLEAKLAIYMVDTIVSPLSSAYQLFVCGACSKQRKHVVISCRDVPEPGTDDGDVFYKDALDEDERRTEAANREREALRASR